MDEMWVSKQHFGHCSHLQLLIWTSKCWNKQSWMLLTHFLMGMDEYETVAGETVVTLASLYNIIELFHSNLNFTSKPNLNGHLYNPISE